MSLVRFGQDDSDVYVFNDASSGKIECCCTPTFRCDTNAEMAEHLKDHRKKGHVVPDWVFEVLARNRRKIFYINQPRMPR